MDNRTDRHHARETQAELQVELRLQDALRAMAIADLKAPLMEIALSSSVISRLAPPDHPRLAEAIHDLRDAVARTLSLVNTAWDDGEGAAGVDLRVTDVAQVVDAAVRVVEPLARARGVRVESAMRVDRALCDRGRTLRAVVTLLSIALRRSSEGDKVAVGAAREGSQVHLTVRDAGEALSDDEVERAFSPAVALDATLPTRDASRARRAITVQGGALSVRCEAGGVVYDATFSAPLTPSQA